LIARLAKPEQSSPQQSSPSAQSGLVKVLAKFKAQPAQVQLATLTSISA